MTNQQSSTVLNIEDGPASEVGSADKRSSNLAEGTFRPKSFSVDMGTEKVKFAQELPFRAGDSVRNDRASFVLDQPSMLLSKKVDNGGKTLYKDGTGTRDFLTLKKLRSSSAFGIGTSFSGFRFNNFRRQTMSNRLRIVGLLLLKFKRIWLPLAVLAALYMAVTPFLSAMNFDGQMNSDEPMVYGTQSALSGQSLRGKAARENAKHFMEQELISHGDDLKREILMSLSPNDLPVSQLCSKHSIYPNSSRWDSLSKGVYFIAINLFQNEAIIADYLFQLTFFIQALKTQKIFLSIYENASSDHTKLAVELFHGFLLTAHIPHKVVASKEQKPAVVHRIEYLAKVRNAAMEPLYNNFTTLGESQTPMTFTADEVTKVIFINDGLFCAEDVLELLLQSNRQESDITCAVDFDVPENPGFYDTWVARDIAGKQFNKYPFLGWAKDAETNSRFGNWLPAQVQCCWNGAVILNARAFTHNNVRFRRSNPSTSECSSSECSLICKDFGAHGYDRAIVVPKSLVAYDRETFEWLLKKRTDSAANNDYFTNADQYDRDSLIKLWKPLPKTVECMGLEGVNRRSPDKNLIEEVNPVGASVHGKN